MAENRKVSNPLSMIAIFAGLTETVTVGVLPFLAGLPELMADMITFTVWFPVLLVVLFFLTLNFNHTVLYAPSDFRDDSHFTQLVTGGYSLSQNLADDTIAKIEAYCMNGDEIDEEKSAEINRWLAGAMEEPVSLGLFMYSAGCKELRARFIQMKNL